MSRLEDRFSADKFRVIYRQAVADVMSFWTPEMQTETARHNSAWAVGFLDFEEYLLASLTRYEICCRSILSNPETRKVCDVGGFFGAFPLALIRMGYEVAMTETLQYYSKSFDPLFSFLRGQGVSIIDFDPFAPDAVSPGVYDAVTAMAVLEHYPHSPRIFMENLRKMSDANTMIYIEVPNILYFPKRLAMLAGISPLVSIRQKMSSEIPFIGHHHEYCRSDILDLFASSHVNILRIHQYNYSFRGAIIKRFISDPLLTLSSLFPGAREVIAAAGKFQVKE